MYLQQIASGAGNLGAVKRFYGRASAAKLLYGPRQGLAQSWLGKASLPARRRGRKRKTSRLSDWGYTKGVTQTTGIYVNASSRHRHPGDYSLFARDPLLNQQGPAAGSSMMFIQGMMLTPTLLGCKPGRNLQKSTCTSPRVGIPWFLCPCHSPGLISSVHRGAFTPALPRNWFLDTGRNSVSQRILSSRSLPFF